MLKQKFFSTKNVSDASASFGLLVMRVAVCGMMLTHGLPKLLNFSTLSQSFDPIGIGGAFSLGLVIFAEVFCSIAVMVGFYTKLAAIPLIVAMCVALFVVHGADPFVVKEKALLYLAFFSAILLIGPGKYSVDRRIFR